MGHIEAVSPALAQLGRTLVQGELWQRPALSLRDRSIVTVSALIARNAAIDLPEQLALALEHGVKARELSGIITHLAFYAGWPNASMAAAAAAQVFAEAGVAREDLPAADEELLPLEMVAETAREELVSRNFGGVSEGVVAYTRDLLFRHLWLRPELAPRDRSLVTVCALVAAGQVAQVPFHLGRALDNGLTRAEAAEVLTHLAFYVGWPNVFSALPVFRDVFAARAGAD